MNFVGMTTSSSLKYEDDAQRQSIANLISEYHFDPGEGEMSFGDRDTFSICGGGTLDVRRANSPGDAPDASDEFLARLSRLLNLGQELVIQKIGYEGLRFPFLAVMMVVAPNRVTYMTLDPAVIHEPDYGVTVRHTWPRSHVRRCATMCDDERR